jgi:hypothetical protein
MGRQILLDYLEQILGAPDQLTRPWDYVAFQKLPAQHHAHDTA